MSTSTTPRQQQAVWNEIQSRMGSKSSNTTPSNFSGLSSNEETVTVTRKELESFLKRANNKAYSKQSMGRKSKSSQSKASAGSSRKSSSSAQSSKWEQQRQSYKARISHLNRTIDQLISMWKSGQSYESFRR